MIITLAGKPGSGKTTVGRLLAKRLGYRFVSVGDLRGEIAERRGMTIDELNALGKSESWTDTEVDTLTKELGEREDGLIIDGRMAWHFIPGSFKVFLDVGDEVAAKRIFANQRPDEKVQPSVEAMRDALSERAQEDRERYKKWYKVDVADPSHYDCIVDTSDLTPEEAADLILKQTKDLKIK